MARIVWTLVALLCAVAFLALGIWLAIGIGASLDNHDLRNIVGFMIALAAGVFVGTTFANALRLIWS